MKTVIVHAGLPKTGSTSIQDFLFAERGALEEVGVLFPSVASTVRAERNRSGESWGRHASLLAAMQDRWNELAEGEWERWLGEFRRFRDDDRLHTLILSHETIGNRDGRDFALLRELLEGCRVRLLLVVREAEAWLTSLYEQRVSGRVRERVPPDRLNTVRHYLRNGYEGRLTALRAAVPAWAIAVASFEALIAGDGLVPNACDLLALPAELRARAIDAKRVNTSLSQTAIELLRRCNAAEVAPADYAAIRRGLTLAQRRGAAPRAARQRIFGEQVARRIARRYRADRDWIEAEFGVVMPEPPDRAAAPIAFTADRLAAAADAIEPDLTPEQAARLRVAALATDLPERLEPRPRRVKRQAGG